MTRPRLSLCMIVRDEEDCLPCCLDSVKSVVDEIIIVDTGSRDRSREIAISYGAKVYDYEWSDDFAAARNASLEKATGEWILYLDADEAIHNADGPKLRALLNSVDLEGYFLLELNHITADPTRNISTHITPRLFRNRPEYRFVGRIHESLNPQAVNPRLHLFRTAFDIRIHHDGYRMDHPKLKEKIQRNLRILSTDKPDPPDNPFYFFNLGIEYFRLKDYGQAYIHFRLALTNCSSGQLIYPRLIKNSVICLIEQQRLPEAISLIWKGLFDLPDFNELYYLWGMIYQQQKQFTQALQCFAECRFLGIPPPHYNSIDGIETYRTKIAMAQCYHALDLFPLEAGELLEALSEGAPEDLQELFHLCINRLTVEEQKILREKFAKIMVEKG